MRRHLATCGHIAAWLVLFFWISVLLALFAGFGWLIYLVVAARHWQSEDGVRSRLVESGSLPRLKAWSLEKIKTQRVGDLDSFEQALVAEESGINARELGLNYVRPVTVGGLDKPADVAALLGQLVSPEGPAAAATASVLLRTKHLSCVEFEFGGGHRLHHGIMIGPTGFEPDRSRWSTLKQWAESVWYYDE